MEVRAAGRVSRLLIDCGFGLKQLDQRLARAGISADDLNAVFITHEHGDHVGAVHSLSRRNQLQIYMSEGTWLATGAPDFEGRLSLARDGLDIEVGDLHVTPFTVPHDAREPLQLRCTDGDRSLGVLTDLGHATPYVLQRLAGVHAMFLEFNHDSAMLAGSAYPAFLKHRVSGNYGHLSNAAAAAIATAVNHAGLKHVVAAHLSAQNNAPALVRQAMADALGATESEMLTASASEGSPWLDV